MDVRSQDEAKAPGERGRPALPAPAPPERSVSQDLRPFLERTLALAGVEHLWIEEDRVRVRAHPELAALFRGEPVLDLALSEEALHACPEALLCTPGSAALDALLQWAGSRPRVYHSRLSLTAGLPPAPPPIPALENASLRPVDPPLSRTRLLLHVLVRVRLESDEVVERLEPILLTEEGRPRPDLVPRLSGRVRTSVAEPATLPDELLVAVESAAERAAHNLTRAQLPAVQVRKAGEMRRLEQYLRGLRDELSAELPAGPARRAAQARADARALLEALRSALTGAGPWDAETLLQYLKPRPRFSPYNIYTGMRQLGTPAGFRNPLPGLNPEQQTALLLFLRRLPRRFTLEEAERRLEQETEARVARLGRAAGLDRSPGELLDEQEARLEREHQARVAQLGEKFHLRVLARPVLLELLQVQALEYRLVPAGAGGPELRGTWDALSAGWELPACPSCAASAPLWLCEDDTVACASCASVCRSCRRARRAAEPFPACARCGDAACPGCGARCALCGDWGCDRHAVPCPKCGRVACSACGGGCSACGAALCPDHPSACAGCAAPLCPEHALPCRVCGGHFCAAHAGGCPHCGSNYCHRHGAACAMCGREGCAPCTPGGRCGLCRSLETVGPATVEALRALLGDVAPDLRTVGLRRWRLAREGRVWIVVARRWPWDHVFVLDGEERRLLARRRRWGWGAP